MLTSVLTATLTSQCISIQINEDDPLIATVDDSQMEAISFTKALFIPGVLEYSFSLFFCKMVNYTFLYWLPLYIKETSKCYCSLVISICIPTCLSACIYPYSYLEFCSYPSAFLLVFLSVSLSAHLSDCFHNPLRYSTIVIVRFIKPIASLHKTTAVISRLFVQYLHFSIFISPPSSNLFNLSLFPYHHPATYSSEESADLSMVFDLGGIVGSIVIGLLSDFSGLSALPCMGMLLLAAPMMILFIKFNHLMLSLNIVMQLILGALLNGPYCLITTSVAVDLGSKVSNKQGLATVSAIVDSVGSIGSAIGPLLAGIISQYYGWNAVFYVIIAADVLSLLLLLRLGLNEIRKVRRSRRSVP